MNRGLVLAGVIIAGVTPFVAVHAASAWAQNRDAVSDAMGYQVSWYTVDCGSVVNLRGGPYSLNGTIGQYDAMPRSGGTLVLAGGYWVDLPGLWTFYLPHIRR